VITNKESKRNSRQATTKVCRCSRFAETNSVALAAQTGGILYVTDQKN
jgi:hypothetical protein